MAEKANIVYMMGDCLKASATSMCGNSVAKMPFMQRMADAGCNYTQVYAANPICTPSRASVFTGVHPMVNMVTCHQHRAPINLPQISEILRDNGYHTAACGHYELVRNLGRGFIDQEDESANGPLRKSYTLWQQSGRRDCGWPCGTLPCSAEESNSHYITDRAIHMIDDAKRVGQPFFLHVAYNDPHSPCFAPPPYDTLIDPACVELPPVGTEGDRPVWHEAALKAFRTGEATEDDLRRFVATYYGMIAHLDRQMERIYEALRERDMLENTWIVIGSDHGDFVGEKGMFSHTESLYECLLHVPLIIRAPEHRPEFRNRTIDQLVDLVDLFPTFLSMAGLEIPGYAQGKALLEWTANGASSAIHDVVYAQVGDYHGHLGDTLPGGRPGCTRHPGLLQGGRTLTHAFTHDPDFGDEAYDLSADPNELSNLLNDSHDVPPAIAALRTRVEEWGHQCLELRRELSVIPGYRGFDKGWG